MKIVGESQTLSNLNNFNQTSYLGSTCLPQPSTCPHAHAHAKLPKLPACPENGDRK